MLLFVSCQGQSQDQEHKRKKKNQNMIFLIPDAGLGSLDADLVRNKNAAGKSGPSCLARAR